MPCTEWRRLNRLTAREQIIELKGIGGRSVAGRDGDRLDRGHGFNGRRKLLQRVDFDQMKPRRGRFDGFDDLRRLEDFDGLGVVRGDLGLDIESLDRGHRLNVALLLDSLKFLELRGEVDGANVSLIVVVDDIVVVDHLQ